MSIADTSDAPVMEPPTVPDQPSGSRKSYRRKYRKIMVTFEEKMRESNTLFKEEQRIQDIAQRLAEQTDQLLQLLLDLNSRPQVPKTLRYDLKPPGHVGSSTSVAQETIDAEEGHSRLLKARHQLQNKQITPGEFKAIEQSLLQSEDFAPSQSYTSLLATVGPLLPQAERSESSKDRPIGYISIKEEDQYLQSLDGYFDRTYANPRQHAAGNLGSRTAERTIEREREMQLKNSVSVYNWLRRHQPQVFLQDNEPEKPSRATGSRTSTRKSAGKEALKQEPELYDDDGIAVDQGGSARGKRKRERDNDGGYRPKGGSSRGTKRKKEPKEETVRSKRPKKSISDAR
ncbi:hypothetical protein LTR84_011754 [Exophiala bonariae]|uniref:IEC3 subunit of the Ino80 complex, chromatin re-modelling-domain-containing protein n=1 Tax=Exophiala bonariae TaxID=1690606 RepID=A0AAV9NJD7_9EURO|nr:hypothetical protein LTR84_011754 [Exophiala bonariae]